MVMDSLDSNSNSIVVVTDMLDPDGSPVIVVIKADGSGTYNSVEIPSNFVKSYYGKDDFSGFIDLNVSADTFIFVDKEKSRKLSNPAKVQFFGKLEAYDFDTIIRQTRAIVNGESTENSKKSSNDDGSDSDGNKKKQLKKEPAMDSLLNERLSVQSRLNELRKTKK